MDRLFFNDGSLQDTIVAFGAIDGAIDYLAKQGELEFAVLHDMQLLTDNICARGTLLDIHSKLIREYRVKKLSKAAR